MFCLWYIELMFKECKSHANLQAFTTEKAPIVEGLIWASLCAVLLKRDSTKQDRIKGRCKLGLEVILIQL